jgi:hypothetical protein
MTASELIARALDLCHRIGRPFPAELRAYASDWQRQGYDLPWCWAKVKGALREGRALVQIEAEVHRHHARLQSEKADRDCRAGEPVVATPTPDADRQRDFEGHQQAVPPPALARGTPDDPDALSAERHPAPRQPYRKRTGTKAHKVRELLKAHVLRRGFIEVRKIERFAKGDGLLEQDQELSRCSTFRRVMKELNVESHRIGFGKGAYYVLRLRPPTWTQRPELGVHG